MANPLDAHAAGWHKAPMGPNRAPAHVATFVGAAACLLFGSGVAALEVTRVVPGASDAIESCVSTQAIRFSGSDRRVRLDAGDAAAVSAAIVRRYPMVERDGLAPQHIVLWRKPDAQWIYIALLENPERAGQVCFTATFTAARFELTPQLIAKYFGEGGLSE
jgi:hypothetical protein